MATFDNLWIVYRPAQTSVRRKSNHDAAIIFALGDTRKSAWQNACRVIYGGAFSEKDETQAAGLRRMGYSAKRCTVMVEA